MTANDIKIFISTYYIKLKTFIKEIVTLPFFWHYCILSVVLIIVFVFITFPYEIIIQNQIKTIEGSIANYISVGNLKIHALTDSYAEDIIMELKSGSEVNISNVTFNFTINPVSLFITHNYDGTIKIKNLNINSENLKIVSDAEFLYNITLDKQIAYPVDGNIFATFSNVSIRGISLKGFEIPDVKLSQIKSELIFQKGNLINIKYLLLSGPEIRGNAYGTISLSNYFQNSSLNITIQIDSQSSILEEYKVLLESLLKPGSKNITFKIMGTIGNPQFITE